MNKHNELEAFLFIKGEPQLKKDVASALGVTLQEVNTLLSDLRERFEGHGVTLVESETECGLATSDTVAPFIEKIEKDERGGELSKASLETLAIILYKNGATRSEIDYIRGVNSSFILRNLYLRGLITKNDEKKGRGVTYTSTVDLLRFLGITSVSELPGYENVATLVTETLAEEEGTQ